MKSQRGKELGKMFLNILKKDLKRKRAMNIILLIFITLATMFVSSSVNNILTVTTALDDYFEMAGVPDYFAATVNKGTGEDPYDTIKNAKSIDNFHYCNYVVVYCVTLVGSWYRLP